MARTLSEEKVLKQLDIPDFRHLTKEKVIEFASMLPRMDPETARKALEQFPDFAATSLSVMGEYKEILENALAVSKEGTQMCYDMYNEVMSALTKMLDEDNLSFDERVYILEQMKEIADKVDQKDTEGKNMIMKVIGISGSVALGITAILATTLGVNLTGSKD